MTMPPTAPSPGKPISASFFARLIAWVKSGQLIEGVGYRLRRTPNGTSLVFDVAKGKASPFPSYWTFSYPKDVDGEEDEQDNEQGKEPNDACWHNCRLQIGYDASFSEVECTGGLKTYEDGVYYAEVNLIDNTWELKRVDGDDKSAIPPNDFDHSKVNVFVGIVEDEKQTYSINCIPVAYKYV